MDDVVSLVSLDKAFILCTIFSRLKAEDVYLKLGLVDPAFTRTRRLFGARRLFIKCIFHYWRFIEPTTKIQQKHLKNVKQCHQICLI